MKYLKQLTVRTGIGILLVLSGLIAGNYGLVSIGVPLLEASPIETSNSETINVDDK